MLVHATRTHGRPHVCTQRIRTNMHVTNFGMFISNGCITKLSVLCVLFQRVKSLTDEQLNGDWKSVCRPAILWAGGLKDLRNAIPGRGYTGFVHAVRNIDCVHCSRGDVPC